METDLDTLEKVEACEVPPPSTLVTGYPPDLEEVVLQALAEDKNERFQTAREFSRALQRFLMRQGVFVGPEDVGDYVKGLFIDRIEKREKYLEWAAEVTSMVNVAELEAQQGATGRPAADLPGAQDASGSHVKAAPGPPRPTASTPGSGPRGGPNGGRDDGPDLASTALVDEDEEIPTVVAMRESAPNWSGGQAAAPPGGYDAPPLDQSEVTAAVPEQWSTGTSPMEDDVDDMSATIALPDDRQAVAIRHEIEAIERSQQAGNPMPPPPPAPGQVQTPAGAAMPAANQAAASPQQAAPADPTGPQAFGVAGGVMQDAARGGAQANIETKLSLPRPAAVSQWIAEQGAGQIEGPRSTAVLMAIALLSTLCVIGIGALVAYKVKGSGQESQPTTISEPSDTHAPLAPPVDPSAAPSASPSSAAPAEATGRNSVPATTGAADPASKATDTAASGEPGTLSVSSDPPCDQVIVSGRALGPCPVSTKMSPGQYRVQLKRAGVADKVLPAIVVSGQVATVTASMK